MQQKKVARVTQVLQKSEKAIKEYTAAPAHERGEIAWVRDGVLLITGLSGVAMGELLVVEESELSVLVMQVENTSAYATALGDSEMVRPGQAVRRTKMTAHIAVSDKLIGRVVDPLGAGRDGLGSLSGGTAMPLEALAPSVMDRQPVTVPLQTGVTAIDALIPIGRGQRELLIGDRQTGKTTIALDTILNQKDSGVICVYVSIGQRDGKTAQVIQTLMERGAMAYTVVVTASASDPAALQYLAPYAGAAVAEFFMAQGKDALVVYDDLTKHAVAYRELSLLLRKPPGREAYPGDVFYIHARLLERAARLSPELGGGSMTALPIIETQAADVSAYIPTNVISITDGQIFLEPKLFHKGIRPAINTGVSVSRVGGAAQRKAMKKVAGQAKLYLAQYTELAAFAQFASELDDASKQQLVRGERLVEILKQSPHMPRALWQQVVLLWVAMHGYFDAFAVDGVGARVESLLGHVQTNLPEFIEEVENSGELSPAIEQKLEALVQSVVA